MGLRPALPGGYRWLGLGMQVNLLQGGGFAGRVEP